MRRRSRKVLSFLALAFVAAILAGIALEQIGEWPSCDSRLRRCRSARAKPKGDPVGDSKRVRFPPAWSLFEETSVVQVLTDLA
jgi:hypothetical protein